MTTIKDILIIGGGINGTAIAADAALRGLTVTLVEKNDLACGTSSASSKLIHGGLRYLEFYEFGLVRKALKEREVLLFRAPHMVRPLEFVLPHEKHLRPSWMIRVGLWLYDHLAKRNILPNSKSVNLRTDLRGKGLLPHLTQGFSYYDCFTDDSRLVILNALFAKEHGADIFTKTEFLNATRENNIWKITLKNTLTQEIYFQYAKALLNVAGPWIAEVQKNIQTTAVQFKIELDKGSHFIVPKLYEGDFAYILQNIDQRVIFAIPYRGQYTLIGTTDVHYKDPLDHIEITDDEKNYLCRIINQYFKKQISPVDIVWSYAGVRCLQSESGHTAATTTRDFKYIKEIKNNALLCVVIGGKLTTHRTLASHLIDELQDFFPQMKALKTANIPLPGGDIPKQDVLAFIKNLKITYPAFPEELLSHYVANYGTRIQYILQNVTTVADLGEHFGAGLYAKEVDYLLKEEWAQTIDDILWRRTKFGLYLNADQIASLAAYIQKVTLLKK